MPSPSFSLLKLTTSTPSVWLWRWLLLASEEPKMSLSTQSCPQPPFQPFTTLLLGPLCSIHLGLYAVGVCMCLNRLRMFHQKVFVLYSSCPVYSCPDTWFFLIQASNKMYLYQRGPQYLPNVAPSTTLFAFPAFFTAFILIQTLYRLPFPTTGWVSQGQAFLCFPYCCILHLKQVFQNEWTLLYKEIQLSPFSKPSTNFSHALLMFSSRWCWGVFLSANV